MMKVMYNGYYGYDNSGDDSFCEVATWATHKYFGVTNHVIIADRPLQLQEHARFVHMGGWRSGKLGVIRHLLTSDLFLCAGGSTLHSVIGRQDPRFYAMRRKQRRRNFKSMAVGVSLGPYRSTEAERSCVDYLKSLDFLALRDRHSFEMASSYDLNCHPVFASDLAFLLPEIYGGADQIAQQQIRTFPDDSTGKRPIIGVSYCKYETYTGGDQSLERDRYEFLKSLIGSLKSAGLFFRFFVFNGHSEYGDDCVTRKLIAELDLKFEIDYELVPYLGHVGQTYQKINECDAVISTRLHASIFSAAGGTPFFLMEYHRKCTDFLDDIGQQPAYRIPDDLHDIAETKNAVLSVVLDREYVEPSNVREYRRRALENFSFGQALSAAI